MASLDSRIARIDWARVHEELADTGHARVEAVLRPAECRQLVRLYDRPELFRKTVNMGARHFGEGEYRYFTAPLPPLVAALRQSLYPPLADAANRWRRLLGEQPGFPPTLQGYLRRCHRAGQKRPTPLLLRYGEGGYNCLHQDLYGDEFFPIQATALLSRRGVDFEGGDFLLVEQRPRMQSRGHSLALEQGDLILFATRERPCRGKRGHHRVAVRHGVSTVRRGGRMTLGVIFHDAR